MDAGEHSEDSRQKKGAKQDRQEHESPPSTGAVICRRSSHLLLGAGFLLGAGLSIPNEP
jgi:hypothetical protein